jgi:putative FmdB family regulatory protein
MPTYDFACPKCTNAEEVTTAMSKIETIEIKCEKCGTKMERLFQRIDFKINGSCYKTDYGPINIGGGMQLRHK